jgi:hypothetical protein
MDVERNACSSQQIRPARGCRSEHESHRQRMLHCDGSAIVDGRLSVVDSLSSLDHGARP